MPRERQSRWVAAGFDVGATVATLARYWLRIVPEARHELRRWRMRADAIPASLLRRCALETLNGEAMNSEAAAVFAMLAPRRYRSTLTRLTVRYQVMYDYLDTVSERTDSAEASLQLHTALTAAIDGARPAHDYYALSAFTGDGGYLADLVDGCRACIASLPSASLVRPAILRAADRCGHAQSFTHIAVHDEAQALEEWASPLTIRSLNYHWWEIAAAGISSLAIHALFAAAAHADLEAAETTAIDAAYFPSVCALSTLFDSLIDFEEDAITGNYSYTGHYDDPAHAGRRLVAIVAEAVELLARLRAARLHRTILAGVAAFYLSASAARADGTRAVSQQVLAMLGPSVLPILWTLGLRREAKHVAARRARSRTRRR